MPKKSKKPKSGASSRNDASDEGSVFNDGASIISNMSSDTLYMKEEVSGFAENAAGGLDDLSQDEIFEEKLREAIDLASQKSAQGRTMALEALSTAFVKKFVPDFVDDRRMTLSDIVERALKKGKPAEQVSACKLLVLVCVQLGGSPSSEAVVRDIRSVLITTMLDESVAPKARAAAAFALGKCSFLATSAEDFCPLLTTNLEKIFSERGGPNAPDDFYDIQTAALSSWTLLYTLLPPRRTLEALENHSEAFERLLSAGNVELRIAAGEAVSVLYEISCESDEEAAFELVEDLVPRLQELSKDSHKYRSKKDRKEQKSSFRDIVKTIEDGEEFYEKVVFSKHETLDITSWAMKKQYDLMCKGLASGMNMHLTENELIRGIFGLGAPLPTQSGMLNSKKSKMERQHANQMAFKWRTQNRNKHRDKRSAVI